MIIKKLIEKKNFKNRILTPLSRTQMRQTKEARRVINMYFIHLIIKYQTNGIQQNNKRSLLNGCYQLNKKLLFLCVFK